MTYWVSASDLRDPTSADADEAARAASEILFALSGRKFRGERTTTDQIPCTDRYGRGGICFNHLPGIRLRHPVREVLEVSVNSTTSNRSTVNAAEYFVEDRMSLRSRAGAHWNYCQDVEVTYVYGTNPPEMGRRAAIVLANELLNARVRPGECKLPARVSSVSRQGVSMSMLDPQDFLKDGRTGLYEVDLFLKAVNPDKARKRARVFSPDLPSGRRITG